MSTQLSSEKGSLESTVEESRQEHAVGLSRDLSVIWVLPSVALCAAYGYLSFLAVAFFSYALSDGRPLPVRGVLLAVRVHADHRRWLTVGRLRR